MVKKDLDNVGLFATMNETDKLVLAKATSFASMRGNEGHLHIYKKGEHIMREGDEGHSMFIVHTGACKAYKLDDEYEGGVEVTEHALLH